MITQTLTGHTVLYHLTQVLQYQFTRTCMCGVLHSLDQRSVHLSKKNWKAMHRFWWKFLKGGVCSKQQVFRIQKSLRKIFRCNSLESHDFLAEDDISTCICDATS